MATLLTYSEGGAMSAGEGQRGFMVFQTLWQLQQGFWVQKTHKSRFWECSGPHCSSPAGASSCTLNETCCCCCRNSPSRGLGLQNNSL